MNLTISRQRHTISARERSKTVVRVAILGVALLPSVSVAMAQVYGVARKTTVVSGPNGTAAVSKTAVVSGPNGTAAVNKTTVVSGGGMPHGYIAVLPGGYRAVTVSGTRYYTVGGVYYRPQMYQGRTVYVAVRL
jgi:nitrate reductase NapE component